MLGARHQCVEVPAFSLYLLMEEEWAGEGGGEKGIKRGKGTGEKKDQREVEINRHSRNSLFTCKAINPSMKIQSSQPRGNLLVSKATFCKYHRGVARVCKQFWRVNIIQSKVAFK